MLLLPSFSTPLFPSIEQFNLEDQFTSKRSKDQIKLINEFEQGMEKLVEDVAKSEAIVNRMRDSFYFVEPNSEVNTYGRAYALDRINRIVAIFNRKIAQAFESRYLFYQKLRENGGKKIVHHLDSLLDKFELQPVVIEKLHAQCPRRTRVYSFGPLKYPEFDTLLSTQIGLIFSPENMQQDLEETVQINNLCSKAISERPYSTAKQKLFKETEASLCLVPFEIKKFYPTPETKRDDLNKKECVILPGQDLKFLNESNLTKSQEHKQVSKIFEQRSKHYHAFHAATTKQIDIAFKRCGALDFSVDSDILYYLSRLNLKVAEIRRRHLSESSQISFESTVSSGAAVGSPSSQQSPGCCNLM